jgi:hypothetical protein
MKGRSRNYLAKRNCHVLFLNYMQPSGTKLRGMDVFAFATIGVCVFGEGAMFWQALEQLHSWERQTLPGADTAIGNEVLIWLLKSKRRPRALKDLYRSSRFSEPTIRNCLRAYSDLGLVRIESNGDDMRTRFAFGTPKLEQVLLEYRRRFHAVAHFAAAEGVIPTSGTAPPVRLTESRDLASNPTEV